MNVHVCAVKFIYRNLKIVHSRSSFTILKVECSRSTHLRCLLEEDDPIYKVRQTWAEKQGYKMKQR